MRAKKKIILFLLLGLFLGGATLTTTTPVQAHRETITVTASSVNVRMGPGLAYDVMAQLKKGDKITVIAHKNSWYQVRLHSDKIGWVASWLLKNTEISATTNTKGTIIANNVVAKEHPADDSDTLGTYQQGNPVTVIYKKNGWSQILFHKTVAWIRSAYITEKKAPSTKQTQKTVDPNIKNVTVHSDNAKLRKKPGLGGKITKVLKRRTQLTYLATIGDWYQVQTDSGKTGYIANWVVTPSASNAPITTNANNLAEATIVLDPGHGGRDSGALSQKKTYEKTYTLAIAKKTAKQLRQAGARVLLTRKSDKFATLASRPALAQKVHADAMISLHLDSSPKDNEASGITTYYYGKSKDSLLGKTLNKQLTKLPIKNRGVEFGNFLVLRENKQPAVLLELGYINDKHDYRQIRSRKFQTKVADAVTTGLSHYFQ